MPISVVCSCGKQLTTADKNAGRRGKCPRCRAGIRFPDPELDAFEAVKTDGPSPGEWKGPTPTYHEWAQPAVHNPYLVESGRDFKPNAFVRWLISDDPWYLKLLTGITWTCLVIGTLAEIGLQCFAVWQASWYWPLIPLMLMATHLLIFVGFMAAIAIIFMLIGIARDIRNIRVTLSDPDRRPGHPNRPG